MRTINIGEIVTFERIKLIGSNSLLNSCVGCYFRSKSASCEPFWRKTGVKCYDDSDPFKINSRIFMKL
jgi:hypothetical protein